MAAHGYFRAEGWWGEIEELDTCQCCHCGAHFAIKPGSGKRRGFCLSCGKVTCGREMCDPCVPMMQQIENVEQGHDRFHKPIKVNVPCDVPKSHLKGGILIGGSSADSE